MIDFGVTPQKQQELQQRMDACSLREEDLEEKFIRSGGPGGQKVNKTASCVYLRHTPTGLAVKMQKDRSQRLNRFFARRRLCELLEEKIHRNSRGLTEEQEKIRKQKSRRRRRSQKGV